MKLVHKNVKERIILLVEDELTRFGNLDNLGYISLNKEEGEEYLHLLGWNSSCMFYTKGSSLPSLNYMKMKEEGWETYTIPVKYEE